MGSLGCCGCSPTPTPTPVCNILVCVKDACTGDPINGAEVQVYNGDTLIVIGYTTLDEPNPGCVTLNVVTAGTYTITVSDGGYVSQSGLVTVTCNETLNYTLEPLSDTCCQCLPDWSTTQFYLTDSSGTYAFGTPGNYSPTLCVGYTETIANPDTCQRPNRAIRASCTA